MKRVLGFLIIVLSLAGAFWIHPGLGLIAIAYWLDEILQLLV
jgi:hypothetical protein